MSAYKENDKRTKEDDVMSAYVKPIQATPDLSGNDAVRIIKQVLKAPSPESIEHNRKILEIRKKIEKK